MRPGVPWSVKGIEPEAREAAKQAARRAGMTLGAWLNQMILDTPAGEEGDQPPSAGQPAAEAAARPALSPSLASLDLGPVTDAVRDLIRRSDESERRTLDMVRRLDQTIEQMASRLAQAEQSRPADDVQATVEAGLSPLSERLDLLAQRMDIAEQHQADSGHPDPNATAIPAPLQNSLALIDDRLAAAERSMATLSAGLEKTQADAVELALKAFSEKVDSEHRQAKVEGVEKDVSDMKERLDRIAHRSTEAIKAIEASLTTVAARLEELGAPDRFVETSRWDALDTKLDELTQHTDRISARTAAAGEAMEQALANFSAQLASSDERFEVLDTLHDTVEQLVHRVGALEARPLAPAPEKISADGTTATDAFAEMAEAEALEEAAAGAAPSSAPTRPDDMPGTDTAPHEPGQDTSDQDVSDEDGPDEGRQETKAAAARPRSDDYLAMARRAAQDASSSGSAPLRGAALEDMPSHVMAYEKERKQHRAKIMTGAVLVLLALGAALAIFLWSDLMPRLDAPANSAPSRASVSGEDLAASPDRNVLGPVEERVFDRDAALSAAGRAPGDTQDAEATDLSAGQEPIGEPASSLAPEAAGSGMDSRVSPRVALLPRPQETTPPATAAPSTPVVAAPIEAAKPSLEAAAASGEAAAQYEMGLRYARGGSVPQDYGKAVDWFKKSAAQGFASAQYRLATLYEKGRGVPEDAVMARTLYEQAAAQGNVKSMHNLAVIYAEGKGTDQDFAQAAHWFGKAAEFGLGDSQYNLAILNERGLGVPQDLAEAHKWFSIAAEHGDAGAAARRDTVANQLDAETLVQAKLSARTWVPRPTDPVANGDIASVRTWAETPEAETDTAVPPSTPADIARVQTLLTELGQDPGPADGVMGARTRKAIRAFQTSAGLADTGEITPDLIDKLKAVTR